MQNPALIFLLDSSFATVAVFDDYESASFVRGFYTPGKFEIHINYNKPNASSFARDMFVVFGGDRRRVGVITSVKRKLGKNGKLSQEMIISGNQASKVFERRIINPPLGQDYYTDKDKAESVIKGLLADQCIGSSDANRNFTFLTLATDLARGITVEVNARLKNLGATIWDICKQADIGISITAPTSGAIATVDVIPGVDRRSSQSTNGRAIFSIESDTAESAEISDSDSSYKNLVYAAGQGVGADRTIVEVYSGAEPTGLARRELYLDARDLNNETDLTLRANNLLLEYGQTVTLDVTALQYSALQLGTDYDLGDLCTISALGVTQDVRITEVQESWASGKYQIGLTFGKPVQTITDQLARTAISAQANQTTSEFGQNSELDVISSAITTTAPRYLGRYLASNPSTPNNGDWWTVYDSDDSPIQRGIWYLNGTTPARITTASSMALQAKMIAAIGDVAWAESNGFGVATDYGLEVVYQSLGAVSAFVQSLFAEYIKVLASIRGGDRYNPDGTVADENVLGFWLGANGSLKAVDTELAGSISVDHSYVQKGVFRTDRFYPEVF